LKNIKEKKMGVECFVIKEACEYKLMSTGEWIKQVPKGSTVSSDGNGNIDKTQYIKYTLKYNTLTFTDMVISDESSMVVLESVLPIVFEKLIILTPIS
jgi:hypothetical protein